MGGGLQAAYVLITNVLITAIVYTAVAIPYSALMAIRTESSEERGKWESSVRHLDTLPEW